MTEWVEGKRQFVNNKFLRLFDISPPRWYNKTFPLHGVDFGQVLGNGIQDRSNFTSIRSYFFKSKKNVYFLSVSFSFIHIFRFLFLSLFK